MEFKELKKKKVSELHKMLAEKREALRELRFKDANKQLKNIREIRQTRNTIAHIFTLLNKNKENVGLNLSANSINPEASNEKAEQEVTGLKEKVLKQDNK